MRLTSLNQDVREKLSEFKEEWQAVSREVRSSLVWRSTSNDTEKTTSRDKLSVSRVLTIGDSQMLPIGSSNPSAVEITLHYEGRGTSRSEVNKKVWQARLCAVLGHICIDNSTKVNISMALNKRMNLYFILFKVKDDYNFVTTYLQNKDLDFVFELKTRERMIAVRHYTIRLTQKRVRRSSWNSWTESRIPFENLMPDYDQHKCCGGCWSGCTPVAWAQIFAYYDRVAHTYGFRYSVNHWKGIIAPGYLNYQVKKYVEALRTPLGTFCDNGGGATYQPRSTKLSSWFNQRQGSGSIMKITTKYSVVSYVKRGFPVMTNIWWRGGGGKKKSGHSVVVTKIKERSRQFKVCRKVGWFFWRSTKCEWKYESQCEWYRRMGWGGKSNAWYPASFTSAFVAIP